ncbi:ZIP family metal transporter [Kineobactrum sediminis]|uniref:ZIP family metal transporter n=1 Tax=Kineobactrum sediminis TaxID=1905677 RepID=A0A2N5Y2H3_9GAMM|nr:ZIP family metal transporter [Kineobactrum sediminis]PLW82587.1 ZIP family metal transporter [Kineobactrum sediminis]
MENTFWAPFFTSLIAASVTALGIYTIRRFSRWGEANISYFMCFAAGVLISASFLHLVPKSLGMNPDAHAWLLAGFLGMLVFHRFLSGVICEKSPKNVNYVLGLLPMTGIAFHSFLDGFIYSITFTVNVFTGLIATLGMVLHEFPEGIIIYLFLLRAGFSERQSLLMALLAAAATTPLGMVISYPFISEIDYTTLGALLALAAGSLLYIGATHLLPEAEHEQKKLSLPAVFAGVLTALLIVMSRH